MNVDLIEKYLCGQMDAEEEKKFEKRMQEEPSLKSDVETVAFIIRALQDVGLERDNEKIKAIRGYVGQDKKRYIVTIAATMLALFAIAAIVSVPIYNNVIKPVVEKIFDGKKQPTTSDTLSNDSLFISQKDSIITPAEETPIVEEESSTSDEQGPTTEVKGEEKKSNEVSESPTTKKEVKQEEPTIKEKVEEAKTQKAPTVVEVKKQEPQKTSVVKVNRVTGVESLKDYSFSSVKAARKGNSIVCSFNMTNTEEDAQIEMHSARATDTQGKTYSKCLLNGKTKRIKDKWKKGEPQTITITIENVGADVASFDRVSFSFQSSSKNRQQNSRPIILKIGDIR